MTPTLDILPPAKTLVNELNPWRKSACQLLVEWGTPTNGNSMPVNNHDEMIAAAELVANLTVRAQHRCFEEEVRA